MIVRIATEAQYELDDSHAARLNELDNAVVDAVEAGNEETYKDLFGQMIALVRDNGTEVAEDEIEASDVIMPPPDLTLEEAGEEFSGDGLIPD